MLKKIFSKEVLINVVIAALIVVALLLAVQFGLKKYTRHNESITLGDLRGETFAQVKNTLESQNLKWKIMDSIYDITKPPNSIVDQNPKPQSKVKEGRTIYLTINAANAPTTEVPDLVGRSSYKYAKMQLESYGLKVGEPIYKPDPAINAVIGMTINGKPVAKKTRVPRGTVVTLILGAGLGNERIPVPDLTGMRLDEAEFLIKGKDLTIGMVSANEGVTDTLGAYVYKQNPAPGDDDIRIGEPIDLWISKTPSGGTNSDDNGDNTDSVP